MNSKGQTLVLFVLILPIIVFIMLLVIDVSNMFITKQELNNINKITNDNIDWDHIYIDYYKYTFRNCHNLKKIENGLYLYDLVGWHQAHISYLTGTFENCYMLKYINFSHVDANANFSGEESPEGSPNEPSKTIFKNCNRLQAIFIGNWDELSSNDRATITNKFNNLLRLSGINPDIIYIYIGKYDLTVIH